MANLRSFNLKGIREDVANFVAELSPQITPFISSIGGDTTVNNVIRWLEDANDIPTDADLTQTHLEGEDVTKASAFTSGTGEKVNYTQTFSKVVKVSKTVAAFETNGRQNETAYQTAKASRFLKTLMEKAVLSGQVKASATATTQSRTSSIQDLIDSNFKAVVAAPKLADFEAIAAKLVKAGSTATIIMAHPDSIPALIAATQEDKAAPKRQYLEQQDNGDIIELATFASATGILFKIVPNVWMKAGDYLFYSPDDLDLVFLREPQIIDLATSGSNDLYLIECECALRLNNSHHAAIITAK